MQVTQKELHKELWCEKTCVHPNHPHQSVEDPHSAEHLIVYTAVTLTQLVTTVRPSEPSICLYK